jgi:carboxymethylenebutenolidase
MVENEISVETPDGQMTTFVARPGGEGSFPVAVLFMDGVGYREQVKHNARRFAANGYCVVAPDLFYRSGEKLTFEFARMGDLAYRQQLMRVIARVTPERAIIDVEATLEAIANNPAAGTGPKVCVGYCMGARLALHAASVMADVFVAAAGIHPSALVTDQPDSPHHDVAAVQGELYFAFSENDQSATAENVARFRNVIEQHHVAGVVELLPGTSHGFAMADLPVYDHEACELHFERTLELWRRNLSNEPVGA